MSGTSEYFDDNNVFFVQGHGAEMFDTDIPRYALESRQYGALTNLPGQYGVTLDFSYFEDLYKDKKRIKIPKRTDNYLIKPQELGIFGKFGRLESPAGIKGAIEDHFHDFKKYLRLFGLQVKDRINVQEIDHVKLYRPRESEEEENVLNSMPNLIYQPGTWWINQHKIQVIESKFGYINIYRKPNIIKYKNVIYHNWLSNIDYMLLNKSGIFRRSQEHPTFKKTDIEDYDSAFNTNKDSGIFGGIHLYGDLPPPIPDFTKSVILVFYPKNCFKMTLGEIADSKKTDPLSYDFVSWYRAAFKESVLTFDDVCLLAIVEMGLYDTSRFNHFKRAISKDIPALIERISPTVDFINKHIYKSKLPEILEKINKYSALISTLADARELLKKRINAEKVDIDKNPDTNTKQLLRKVKGLGDLEIYMAYKFKSIAKLFFELKKSFKHEEIQALALGLYVEEIVNCSTNIEFIYKFLKQYGSVNGPMMVIPFICRNVHDASIGGMYSEIRLIWKQPGFIPKKMLKNVIEERRMLTRPERKKTRSRSKKPFNKTRKN